MKTNSKITLLVSAQIILILASFLTLSYFESEKTKFGNSITIVVKIRQLSDSLIFETERHFSEIPYADPQSMMNQMISNFILIKTGGTLDDLIIKPLPAKFVNTHDIVMQKLTIYTKHIEQILTNGNLKIDFKDSEFLALDTVKFDSNGSLDYLLSILIEESKIQSNNIIILEIGLAILNVGIHIMLIIFILDILRKQSKKEIKLGKLASIGELSSSLAHNLRNPLNVIHGSIELLSSQNIQYSEKQNKRRFKMIKLAISQMTHQLEDVMDFVRTSELYLEKTSMLGIIHSAVNHVSVPESIHLVYPDSDYDLKCDKVKLEIVFINLISNAIDAINENGEIKIQMKNIDGYLEIDFEDSGDGIKQNDLEKIFEALFTLKQKGTGLGLASCKNIIEQHGGTISVRNNPTTFSIKIPTNL